jgi:UDP-N-acetylmuramyl pentapeptide phosphotransferase/UDP-N-acetylglucosamine-1-phosphate transferase
MMTWIIVTVILFSLAAVYLTLANKLNIIDKPNQRSSHTIPVVRGGGIIFPIAWVLYSCWNGWVHPWFTSGLIILSIISFWDDLRPLSAAQRSIFHAMASVLLITELSLWTVIPFWAIALVFIGMIGVLNAFNFMDGINGITGMYALAILFPLLPFITVSYASGLPDPMHSPIFIIIISMLVFGFYNFRKRARCFAGDVGSISTGYILLFILMSLMTDTEMRIGLHHGTGMNQFQPAYILMFSVYGIDSVLTILHRLRLGENIFEAHRRHLYQFLANEKGLPHLMVSFGYALIQSAINIYLLNTDHPDWISAFLILAGLACIYIWIKSPQIFKRVPTS